MPLVNIKGISGYLTLDQKKELISKVTEAALSVEGEGLREATWVIVVDAPSGAWGVGGRPTTDNDLRRLAGR